MSQDTEPVLPYPRILVQLRADGSAHVDVAGRTVDYPPAEVDQTRIAVLAHAVEVARLLGRPVRMSAEEPDARYIVAVHPDGALTELGSSSVRAKRSSAPASSPKESPLEPAAAAHEKAVPEPIRAPTRGLRLTIGAQEPLEVVGSVALGRDPSPVNGRTPVPVQNPSKMLSRTHALIDIDADGKILVTDHHSGNGIEISDDSGERFQPDVPYAIQPGITLLMGDVLCTIELIR